jgi:hypothetical protein
MIKKAFISGCNNYRYALDRIWDDTKPKVMFLMLNPSTADDSNDDPTIRRCIGFAKSWGYGGLHVGNLFAYRSTDPKNLLTAIDPIGEENKHYLKLMASQCDKVVCAWGNSGIVNKLLKKNPDYKPLLNFGLNTYYIDLCNDGTPKHPLYLKGDLSLKNY